MVDALSTHYARAFADAIFAPTANLLPEDALKQLSSAEAIIAGSKNLQIALLSPAVSKNRKVALTSKLAEALNLHRLVRNFLLVLVTHRRIHELKFIRQNLEEVIDERLGWVRAEITSARELSPAQRGELERALGGKLGKSVRADYKIDPEVLAGVRARVASREYDATLKGKLESMRQRLHAGV